MSIISIVRNTYYSYRLCKYILENSELHECSKKDCEARNNLGTFSSMPMRRAFSKRRKVNEFIGNKWDEEKARRHLHRFVKDLRFDSFAETRGYIETLFCDKKDEPFHTITDKGIELTDNLFLPFTPIGLWKQLWFEHKVIFSLIYSVIGLLFGGTMTVIIKLVRGMIGAE